MKLAIVGGTRFIGHTIASVAIWRGHEVTLFHRGQHPSEVAGASDVLVDRDDPVPFCAALERAKPDALIDTRAMTRSQAEVTALALKLLGIPGVVLSSIDVYAQFGRLNGLPAPEPEAVVTESALLTIPYPFRGIAEHEAGPDYDKKDVERELLRVTSDGAPAVTVLRLCAVYGTRDPKRRLAAIIDRFDRGERVLPEQGGASWRHAHAHVRDVAHASVLSAEKPGSGYRVFNVSEARTPSMRERAEELAQAMDVSFEWRQTDEVPPDLEALGKMPNDLVIDSSKIRSELGFSEVTQPEERALDVIAWARASR